MAFAAGLSTLHVIARQHLDVRPPSPRRSVGLRRGKRQADGRECEYHEGDSVHHNSGLKATLLRSQRDNRVDTRRSATRAVAATYHLTVTSGANHVPTVFPEAVALGDGQFEIQGGSAPILNQRLADLLQRGALITALIPAHSGLEAEFREAVRALPNDSGGAS